MRRRATSIAGDLCAKNASMGPDAAALSTAYLARALAAFAGLAAAARMGQVVRWKKSWQLEELCDPTP